MAHNHEWRENRFGRAFPHVDRALICSTCGVFKSARTGEISGEPNESAGLLTGIQQAFKRAVAGATLTKEKTMQQSVDEQIATEAEPPGWEPQINPLSDFTPETDYDTLALIMPLVVVLTVALVLWACGVI